MFCVSPRTNLVYHDVDSYQSLLNIMTSDEFDKKRS